MKIREEDIFLFIFYPESLEKSKYRHLLKNRSDYLEFVEQLEQEKQFLIKKVNPIYRKVSG